jgi:colicin import membrane protein
MKRPFIISGIAHAIVLGWGLIAFAARPNEAPQAEALPVEFVSSTEFSQLAAGAKNAPKPIEDAKPLVDKVGDPKPVKELAPKIADKPEIKTTSEPKAAEKAEKPKEKPKTDQVADALKKDESKKPPKKPPEFKPDQIAEQLKKEEAKKSSPKYDANQIAALLDHREPQRQIATGATLNGTVSLGSSTGNAAHLSQSELDALRARLSQCWNPPAGLDVNSNLYVMLHVSFRADGSLAREPEVVEDLASSLGPALAESAKRAVMACQPFTMLKSEHYDLWKEIEIKFNNELLGG